MGFNTVAVLYNDFIGDLKRDQGRYGPEIAKAMQVWSWPPGERRFLVNFGAGMVISQAHADAEQVVIVSQNSGCRADDATGLGWQALHSMKACLERHGYTVTKKRRAKATDLGRAALSEATRSQREG